MKQIFLRFILFTFLFESNTLFAQRKIESSKVLIIEQEGDSVFCREKETLFEVLDFEFDSCNFYNNRFSLTFSLINKTKRTLFLDPGYISWYDTNSLRPKGNDIRVLKPDESLLITLESIPYAKKRMNSPGRMRIADEKKEIEVSIRLKQESSKVIHCKEGQELIK